jgi:hypothetical protein
MRTGLGLESGHTFGALLGHLIARAQYVGIGARASSCSRLEWPPSMKPAPPVPEIQNPAADAPDGVMVQAQACREPRSEMAAQGVERRIESLDISLYAAIPSQTTAEDRCAFLLLQRCVRAQGSYVYLEIGSYLGGTILPHYADPRCTRIYSVDKRPAVQPDERGREYVYPDNTAAKMRAALAHGWPAANADKIVSFDCDARAIAPEAIVQHPVLCLIDGEHTNAAVLADFRFCLAVAQPHAIIAMHDANIVFRGIREIKALLRQQRIPFEGLKLGGSVYAILLRDAVGLWAPMLRPQGQSEKTYFRRAYWFLWATRLHNRVKARLRPLRRWLRARGRG